MTPSQTEPELACRRRLHHGMAARGFEPSDATAPSNAPETVPAVSA